MSGDSSKTVTDSWKLKEFRQSVTDKIHESFTAYKEDGVEVDPNSASLTENNFFRMYKTKYEYLWATTKFLKYREEIIRTKGLRAQNVVKIQEALLKYGNTNSLETVTKNAEDIEKKFYSNAESKDEYKELVSSVLENDRKEPKNPLFRRILLSEHEDAVNKWGTFADKVDSVHEIDEMFFSEAETKEEYFDLVASYIYKMINAYKYGGRLDSVSFLKFFKQTFWC